MYEYQTNKCFFAQISDSLKELGEKEFSELGADKITTAYKGIYFNADKETLYRINYCTKLASRILAPLLSFNCRSTDYLYKKAKTIEWSDFISKDDTFAVFANVSDSVINNSHYASLCLKDSVVDSFRDKYGERPDIDTRNPSVWINLYIRKDDAVISLDTAGGSLHRRGYRKNALEAPMQETIAAAIIKYSEWNGSVPLYDPMCGSGTLLSEALMHYCKIPTGIFRERFGFEFLPDYDKLLWLKIKRESDGQIRVLPQGCISGSDISLKAIEISRVNIESLRSGENIKLGVMDFRESEGLNNGFIVTNPPYGIRMGEKDKLDVFYKSFGDFLKQKCKGSSAYVYFGERELIKKIGLKAAWKKPLEAGGLDGRLVKYELF